MRGLAAGAPDRPKADVPAALRGPYHRDLVAPVAAPLAELGATEDAELGQKNVLAAVDHVAERLGNTRDIARSSYVSPRVIDHYMEGSVIAHHGERIEEVIAAEQGGLADEEGALLGLLNKERLRPEPEEAA